VTVLALAGIAASPTMQGVSLVGAAGGAAGAGGGVGAQGCAEYTEEEEREVEDRLRALGYLP